MASIEKVDQCQIVNNFPFTLFVLSKNHWLIEYIINLLYTEKRISWSVLIMSSFYRMPSRPSILCRWRKYCTYFFVPAKSFTNFFIMLLIFDSIVDYVCSFNINILQAGSTASTYSLHVFIMSLARGRYSARSDWLGTKCQISTAAALKIRAHCNDERRLKLVKKINLIPSG